MTKKFSLVVDPTSGKAKPHERTIRLTHYDGAYTVHIALGYADLTKPAKFAVSLTPSQTKELAQVLTEYATEAEKYIPDEVEAA